MSFKCYIVGDSPLAAQCGEILLERGHLVLGMLSDLLEVRDWAGERGVECLDPQADLGSVLLSREFDYLFSAGNLRLLPAAALSLPRKAAINFHDGPLPRYAGLHATSWALMRGERRHGVTWHLMTEKADEGDVLVQAKVEIEEGDTAFFLNLKCFEAGVSSFRDLVAGLERGTLEATPQDLAERTYFGRYQRPEAAALIDWQRPATEIDALVRGLEFGRHPNPLGRAKMAVGRSFLLCPKVAALRSAGECEPGRIMRIEPERIVVASGEGQVAIERLLTPAGAPISSPDVVARFSLEEGCLLPLPDPGTRTSVTKQHEHLCRYESYWVDQLRELRPPCVPFIRERETSCSCSASVDLEIPDLGAVREGLAPGEQAAAAFAAYIARLSGEGQFDIGLLSAEAASPVSGLFAEWLPVRLEVRPGKSVGESIHDIAMRFRDAQGHGTFLGDLPARHPQLAGSGDVSDRLPVRIAVLGDGHAAPEGCEIPAHREGTSICLVLRCDGRGGRLVHDIKVVSARAAEVMAGQYLTFLKAAIASPDEELRRLPLHSTESMDRLLTKWNDTAVPLADGLCVHGAFEEQVRRTPRAEALICGEETLTYEAVDQRANRLAHCLRDLGAGPDQLVGISVTRSSNLVISVLAVLKAGAAYLPLDPSYPAERLRFMMEDSGASLLVTEEGSGAQATESTPRIVHLRADAEAISKESSDAPNAQVEPENLAYVIYTSGSTGRPKGVMVEHRNVLNFFEAMDRCLGVKECSTWLAATSLSFDISVLELLWTLVRGHHVILHAGPHFGVAADEVLAGSEHPDAMRGSFFRPASPGDVASHAPVPAHSESIPALMHRRKVTHLQCTPSQARMLVMDEEGKTALSGLRKLLVGGEALPLDLARELADAVDGEVINMYGPTETTVWSTTCPVEPGLDRVLIGRPVANTRVYIVDEDLQPVPVGVAGELLIGGAGVARGYLNRPELTAARFVADPFGGRAGGRLYRTGDQARFMADGRIEFLWRSDRQVKIRGHRIELGEIECRLLQHPAVREVAVVAVEANATGPELAAYVVPASGASCEAQALRAHLREALPSCMVPSRVALLETLPRTPNQKTDRQALVNERPTGHPPATGTVQEERDGIAAALAEIWAETLGVDRVGLEDGFFDLGGHSLNAFEVTLKIRKACGIDLPLETIFSAPTPAGMAERLRVLFEEKARLGASRLRCGVQGQAEGQAMSASSEQARGGEPASDVERRLAVIWQRVLGVKGVERGDDFFALGGTSLLAVRLFVDIEEQFGRKLPLAILFQAPTLARLAGELERETEKEHLGWSCLVPIQPMGTRPPFFCVHDARGNVLKFHDLGKALGQEYPFFGVQCRGLDDPRHALGCLEEMAARYLDEVRAVQPQGPYFLGGFCMGGTLAYEMAQQLVRAGEEVALVAIIDAFNSSRLPPPGAFQKRCYVLLEKIRFHGCMLKAKGPGGALAYVNEVAPSLWRRQAQRLKTFVRKHVDDDVRSPTTSQNIDELERLNEGIDLAYEPVPCDGPVVLIRPSRGYCGRPRDPEMGWGGLSRRGLDVVALPVNNARGLFVEPYVRDLARELRMRIEGGMGDA